MSEGHGPLGTVSLAATSLYVADLDRAIAWYRDKLRSSRPWPAPTATATPSYLLGGVFVVLEPVEAALEAAGPGGESTTVNLLVDREPAEVRTELLRRGVECGPVVDSPGFSSFLVRDLDGNRFYVSRPVSEQARRAVESAGAS